MPNPLNVPITPPRVAFIDPRTGNVSREWYMFFLSLFTLTGGSNFSLDDLQKGPPTLTVDEITHAINKLTENLTPSPGTSELQAELNAVRQELQLLPRQELGTMAALQQDNVPWLQFDTTPSGMPTGVNANGTLYWDDADAIKTLNIVMEDSGEVIQHIGEKTYYRVKASAAITNGQVVMFTGTVGASGGLRGAPATGLTATQNEYIMGVATQDIANNGWGYVTWFGEVRGVNTTGGAEAWVDGQILYYNPAVAGGLTKNVPTAPNPKVIVASVVHAATNGILFVRPTFGSALGSTDSNVEITGLANGDLLQYDGGQQRWENVAPSTITIGTATNLAGGLAGSLPYQSAPGTTAMLGIGTSGQWLRSDGTSPVWTSPAALTKTDDTNVTLTLGGSASTALLNAASLTLGWTGQLSLARGGTNANLTAAAGGVIYSTATAMAVSAAGSSGNWLKSNGTAAPTWTAAAALTKTDDTNVTLTLGGSASTALLNAASLTLGWSGTLAVSRGGTGTGTAGIGAFNNITGYTATGATGLTSSNLVFSSSPTLTTPVLGAATATSINGLGITTTTGTLTVANGKTLTANNSLTLAGTDGTTMTFPSTSASIARTDAAQSFTGVQTFNNGGVFNYVNGVKIDSSGTTLGQFYYSGGLIINRLSGTSLLIQQNNSSEITLTSGGDVQIGSATGATYRLFVYKADNSWPTFFVRQDGTADIAQFAGNGGSVKMAITRTGNIYGTSGTTGMTDGFFYIPAAAGAPTGAPTAVSGTVPMYYDTTNNKFYVYNGAWKSVALT